MSTNSICVDQSCIPYKNEIPPGDVIGARSEEIHRTLLGPRTDGTKGGGDSMCPCFTAEDVALIFGCAYSCCFGGFESYEYGDDVDGEHQFSFVLAMDRKRANNPISICTGPKMEHFVLTYCQLESCLAMLVKEDWYKWCAPGEPQ